ncbi:hypothetical protein JX265_001795 [Neoarthrinium moseri]|uniref:Thioesterase domain-containing protein n=1 Tax=Neoarthrinium moseri TaxID=1658444 RepID=A0A9Q0ATM9_9PEZI|nr:hypothetical protein JX265_001795 [Neoarthrinium moseri]
MGSDDFLSNPALIYEGPDWLPVPRAPLVLAHDGGGTTFSYHCLDPTNRALYGIENAHLHQGGYWEGGIQEMAKHYIQLIARSIPAGGNIILGGWSLGGILSLEMAHQIATDTEMRPRFTVLGIIMIDSICPRRTADLPAAAKIPPPQQIVKTDEEMKAMKLKEKVALNMAHARIMVPHWDKPQWTNSKAPPTVLLRAKETVDHADQKFVDVTRHDRMLGWGPYSEENGNFIRTVVDIEGHHFSVFADENIAAITVKICAAANDIEAGRYSK